MATRPPENAALKKGRRPPVLLYLALLAAVTAGALTLRLAWQRTRAVPPGPPPAPAAPPEASEAAFRARVEAAPGEPQPRLALGRFLLTQGRAWEALDAAREARARFPQSKPVALLLAEAQVATGQGAEAAGTLTAPPASDPYSRVQAAVYLAGSGEYAEAARLLDALRPDALRQDPDLAFQAAQAYGNALETEKALPLLRTALEGRPDSVEVRTYYGSALLMLGRYREAEAVLAAGLKGAPEDAALLFHAGSALRLAGGPGSLPEAERRLAEAAAKQPGGRMFHYELGAARLALGGWREAREALERAAAQPPTLPEVQRDLARACDRLGLAREAAVARSRHYLTIQDWPRAKQALAPLAAKHSADLTLAAALAEAHLQGRTAREAIPLLERLRKQRPDEPALLWALYRCYRQTAENARALEAVDALVAAAPNDLSALDHRSEVLQALQRYPEAEAVLQQLRDREPDNAFRHFQLGLFHSLWMQGPDSTARAEEYFRRAIELKPDFVGPRYRLGLLLLRDRRHEEAIVHLRHALDQSPDFADGLRAIGRAYTQAGDRARAEEAFRLYRRSHAREQEKSRLEQPARYQRASREDRLRLARFYLKAGDLPAATGELEVLAHFHPEDRESRRLLMRLYGYGRRFQRQHEERIALGGGG